MEQERSDAVSMAGPASDLHSKLFYDGCYMISRIGLKMSREPPDVSDYAMAVMPTTQSMVG